MPAAGKMHGNYYFTEQNVMGMATDGYQVAMKLKSWETYI